MNGPCLGVNSRSVWYKRDVITTGFDYARGLTLLLCENVAENTAFFGLEVLASRAQLVKHAPRHKHGGCDLRGGMAEFLTSVGPVVLIETDVLDARIALE